MWNEVFLLLVIAVVHSEMCGDVCDSSECEEPVCGDGEVIKEKGDDEGCCDICVPEKKDGCIEIIFRGLPEHICFTVPTTTPKPVHTKNYCIPINFRGEPTCIYLNATKTMPNPGHTGEDCIPIQIMGEPMCIYLKPRPTTPTPGHTGKDCIPIEIRGEPKCIYFNTPTTTPTPEYTKKKRHHKHHHEDSDSKPEGPSVPEDRNLNLETSKKWGIE